MRHDNAVENSLLRIRQGEWERPRARTIEKEAFRVLSNPSFGSPHLFCGCKNCPTIPTSPILLDVAAVWKYARLVGKDDDVVLEDNEEITDFFPIAADTSFPLIAIYTGKAPKA